MEFQFLVMSREAPAMSLRAEAECVNSDLDARASAWPPIEHTCLRRSLLSRPVGRATGSWRPVTTATPFVSKADPKIADKGHWKIAYNYCSTYDLIWMYNFGISVTTGESNILTFQKTGKKPNIKESEPFLIFSQSFHGRNSRPTRGHISIDFWKNKDQIWIY